MAKKGITIDKGHDKPVYTQDGLRKWREEQKRKKKKRGSEISDRQG